MYDQEPIVTEFVGQTAVVTLNRPKSLNALRSSDKAELARVISSLSQDARAVMLIGNGDRAFCAGADIKEMANHSVASCVASLQAEAELFDSILKSPVAVIAAVKGYALGLGLIIACCCDLTVSSKDATLGMPEIRNSVPAGMQTQLLVQLVGLGRARQMLYTGMKVDAQAAHSTGLVGELVEQDADVYTRALETANSIAKLPAKGVELQKRVIDTWLREPFNSNIQSNLYLAARAFADDSPREAIEGFLTQRQREGVEE